jgi:hypothetical protein
MAAPWMLHKKGVDGKVVVQSKSRSEAPEGLNRSSACTISVACLLWLHIGLSILSLFSHAHVPSYIMLSNRAYIKFEAQEHR